MRCCVRYGVYCRIESRQQITVAVHRGIFRPFWVLHVYLCSLYGGMYVSVRECVLVYVVCVWVCMRARTMKFIRTLVCMPMEYVRRISKCMRSSGNVVVAASSKASTWLKWAKYEHTKLNALYVYVVQIHLFPFFPSSMVIFFFSSLLLCVLCVLCAHRSVFRLILV